MYYLIPFFLSCIVLYPTSQHYINIHSHRKPQIENEFVVRNAFLRTNVSSLVQLPYALSVGLHPWHIQSVNSTQLTDILIEQATLRNVLAIGEIGLDKAIEIPMVDQVKVFEVQFQPHDWPSYLHFGPHQQHPHQIHRGITGPLQAYSLSPVLLSVLWPFSFVAES